MRSSAVQLEEIPKIIPLCNTIHSQRTVNLSLFVAIMSRFGYFGLKRVVTSMLVYGISVGTISDHKIGHAEELPPKHSVKLRVLFGANSSILIALKLIAI